MPTKKLSYEELLYADTRFFYNQLWQAIGSENEDGTGRAPLSEYEYDGIDFLNNGPTRRGILGFRGIGKTYWLAGRCARLWYRDPNRRIIILSKAIGEATKTSVLLRSWFEKVPFLKKLKPEKGRRDNVLQFDVGGSIQERQPSLFITGIGGQTEGNRAHSIFPDDVETKKNSMTLAARTELRRVCGEFVNMLYPDRPPEDGGPIDPVEIVYNLTPKHEETLAKDLESEGFEFRAYPMCVPGPDEATFNLSPGIRKMIAQGQFRKSDGCLVPHRFSENDVTIRRAKRSEWLREFQLVRTLGETDRYPLKLKDFIVFQIGNETAPVHLSWGMRDHNGSTALDIQPIAYGDDRFYSAPMVDKVWAPFTGTKMRIDQAGKGKDIMAFAVSSHLNGFIHFRRLGGLRGGASEQNFETLAKVARDTNATTMTVETNFGGDAYANSLQVHCNRLKIAPDADPLRPAGWACNVETKHSHVKKEIRIIDSIEPWLGAHRVVITPEIALMPDFQRQITQICREGGSLENDDYADVFAGMLDDWTDMSRIDPNRRAGQDADSPEVQERIKKLMRKHGRGTVNWIGRGKPSALRRAN